MEQLELESKVSALPPVVLGGVVVVPMGLLAKMSNRPSATSKSTIDTQAAAARAREIIMEIERRLGLTQPTASSTSWGYDIESRVPGTGKLRFIEVKGRVTGADTITVTKNEILYS
jgi:hypothetical protein